MSKKQQLELYKSYRTYRGLLFVIICLLNILMPYSMNAQTKKQKEVMIHGSVQTAAGEPLENVLVDLKESLFFTLTDKDGRFTIKVPEKSANLIFTLEGYKGNTLKVGSMDNFTVTLEKLDEFRIEDKEIFLMYGKQKKSQMTSAVSTVDGRDIQDMPVSFQNAALAGRLPGLLTIQESGAPGADDASLYMRGRRSWRNRNPLVFVDGHRRSFSLVDPHEIEQISVYKDASALAIFGLRGGNGALMATTRRGKEGKPVLKFNSQVSFSQSIKTPDFLDSWHFSKLYNEAMYNDDPTSTPRYTDEDLRLYQTGESPYTHPNVNWLDEFLKDVTISQKYNLSIEGGSSVAKYFVNLSFLDNAGAYKTDDRVNTYNTNAGMQTYSIRSNVDIAITKSTDLAVSLYGRQRLQNNPGGTTSSSTVFNTLYSIPSNIFPVNYGPDKVAGRNEFRSNPYGILNHSGYSKYIHSTMEATAEATQRLDFITPGLKARASIAFDARFDNTINRSKAYSVYQYKGTDPVTGELQFDIWGQPGKQTNLNSYGDEKPRILDLEAGVDYNRTFGAHDIYGSFVFNNNQESTDTQKMTNIHQGVFGRATYIFGSRYIGEFSFGYQGTEQLPPSKRYGFFPAGSVGWVVSEEPFIKDKTNNIINLLKFRASYGLTGNDDGIPYFYYLPSFKRSNSSYNFGVDGGDVKTWVEDGLFNERVTWEESLKLNLGMDMRLFSNKFGFEFNYFTEKTTQILTTRMSVSTLLGIGASTGPLGNVGETQNKGFEIASDYRDRIGSFHWNVGASLSYARNEILFNDEQNYEFNYRRTVGQSINSQFGFESNGLYYDEQDRLNSPNTSFGTSYAGDIKYRDLNGDGIVDIQDQHKIGNSNLADLTYSFNIGANYKGFDFNVLFSGVTDRDFYLTGVGIQAFTNISGTGGLYDGNVLQYHWDNRYNPQDQSTWATASYPRLSLAGRNHNSQKSNYWIENGDYLRLKSLVVGYTLPKKLTRKFWVSDLRVFYSGYNLLTWDNMRTIDPESSANANNYPVQKVSSVGINIHF